MVYRWTGGKNALAMSQRKPYIMQPLLKDLLALLVLVTLSLSGGSAAAQHGHVRAAIEAENKAFIAAFRRGDSAGIAALYTTDGQLFPPSRDIITGTQAIEQFWRSALESGTKGATLTTVEVEDHGDTAYEVGTYTMIGEGGKVLDSGKYVGIWKHAQGKWKLYRDIWNTNMPAPQQ
jgi:uncharacterized protein (TIGR02246 family)